MCLQWSQVFLEIGVKQIQFPKFILQVITAFDAMHHKKKKTYLPTQQNTCVVNNHTYE